MNFIIMKLSRYNTHHTKVHVKNKQHIEAIRERNFLRIFIVIFKKKMYNLIVFLIINNGLTCLCSYIIVGIIKTKIEENMRCK